jgi:hypothetical protein
MPRIIVRQKPDTICPDATVENSDATYTDTVASGGALVLPDTDIEVNGVNEGSVPSVSTIDFQLTDGVNPVTPDSVTVVGNVVTVGVPKPLELLVPYSTSDTTATFTVVTGSDGTITSADTTGLTSVTYEVNATPETIPFTLSVGDVVTIDFDAAAADGVIKLIGTYA